MKGNSLAVMAWRNLWRNRRRTILTMSSIVFGVMLVAVIDPRTAFASEERFPRVDLLAEWPQEVLQERPLDAYTALVAVTHDHGLLPQFGRKIDFQQLFHGRAHPRQEGPA